MDKQLKNIRPSGEYTTNVLCGLVKGLSDERVLGCGASGRMEQFYYDLDEHNLVSSVSLCEACAGKQKRLVRYAEGTRVMVTLRDGQPTPGEVFAVLGFHRADDVWSHTDVWYKVRYQRPRESMPVVGLFRQTLMRKAAQ